MQYEGEEGDRRVGRKKRSMPDKTHLSDSGYAVEKKRQAEVTEQLKRKWWTR